MSNVEVVLAIVLGLLVNELTDVSPWLARKLVAWSARLRYRDTSRAEVRAEELAAVINDRPGKLFKLGTGVRFLSAALAIRLRHLVTGSSESTDEPGAEKLLPGPILPLEDEPTAMVARYLFPTERYRGEWRRHWINPVKSLAVIALYAVLGIWATVRRIEPRYVAWVVAAIVVTAVLTAAFRLLSWYLGRFVITNKRLMSTEGVLARRVAMMPLLRVVDVRYVQSPVARLFNYGTFRLESAGRANAMREIVDLPNPDELYLRLVEEIYEPAAVEARLGTPDLGSDEDHGALDGSTGGDAAAEAAPVDPAAVQREIIYQIGALSAQLSTLAAAIQRLTPAPGGPAQPPDADRTPAEPATAAPAAADRPEPAEGPGPAGADVPDRGADPVRPLLPRARPGLAE
ncbi:PH domain-containing protein [Plantactinospora solaniradicis]|uniref:PH domain-containing protein n=1 Tax=Plantactinospora solaniradicis TaxID=1723736 RepID=A0ABW1K3S2_9ACTN